MAELLSRAQAGDADAFRALAEPYWRELQLHAYRMLGSLHDAEDVLQDSLLVAWQGVGGFEQRSSLRTWLYRIVTNRSLNAMRAVRRRPATEWNVPGVPQPEGGFTNEVTWLEPCPESLSVAAISVHPGPDARIEQRQSISLAFLTALQLLPPRQVAVLVLRDVLGFSARDVAQMLDATLESVTSALKRARARLDATPRAADPQPSSAEERALLQKFVTAYEASDVDALAALLTDDVFISMPPMRFAFRGRDAVLRFCATLFRHGRQFRLLAARAHGQPAFGTYLCDGRDALPGVGALVLSLADGRISSMVRFERGVLPSLGLAPTLAAR